MKKTFKLQTMEMAEAAVKDAESFGLTASLEEVDGEISVGYCSPEACSTDKAASSPTWDDVYAIARNVANEYEYQLKWLREEVDYMQERFSKHTNGHIPAILDSGQMEKALKVLGLGDSFVVQKPVVWVQY